MIMTDAPSQQPAHPPTPAIVADVMRPPLTTANQHDHAAAAAYLMKHAGASALMVLNRHTGQPIGMTEKDITHAVADGKDLEQTRIHNLMTARPTVINPTTSIPDAARLISRGHFRHLPVSGDTGLIGMLDITDVCRGLSTPTSPSGPPPATPGRGSPSGTARGQISVQNTAICAPAGRRPAATR
jgi:CBS domain-containing protein